MGVAAKFVVVTGAAGAVAKPVCEELRRRGHRVRGFDRAEMSHVDEAVLGDLADADAVNRAIVGADAVVHLAAFVHGWGRFMEDIVEPNVVGLFRVLDAARQAKVGRVLLASTMQVVSGCGDRDRVLTGDDAAPRNFYALSKLWAERMGEMYARVHGMSVIAGRIGWFPRDADEADRLHRKGAHSHYLSHRDAGRFFAHAVEAEFAGYATLYALSRPVGAPLADLESAKRVIGYEPLDVFPDGLAFAWSAS
jgi:uronate dehydrogenase